ncbi:MAG: ribosome-binding factor A [Hyphomicrobiales bacterium]|nr:ribosome-binding factor A [Hyphomicrobiales bacterium]
MRSRPRHSMHQPGQRQLRVGELLRRRLADLFLRTEFEDAVLGRGRFALTEVRLSADLKWARAYVMPLHKQTAQDEPAGERAGARTHGMAALVEALNRHAPALRRQMVQGLHLKFAPQLQFVADERIARAHALEQILRSPSVQRDLAAERPPDGVPPDG